MHSCSIITFVQLSNNLHRFVIYAKEATQLTKKVRLNTLFDELSCHSVKSR